MDLIGCLLLLAQDKPSPPMDLGQWMMPIILVFAFVYFFMIRPQKREQEAKKKAFYADYNKFNSDSQAAGVYVDARRLKTTDSATTLRVEGDEVTVTDGPFAETKEALAGFYLIEAEDLDAALAWARRLPGARIGSVEVRPIHRYGE